MSLRLSTEERQAEIVAAAVRLAQQRSPAMITTADIAAAIGVTQGALFKHFPTKDAIWQAVMRWVREALLARLQAVAEAASSPLEALGAMFRAHVVFVMTHPGVPRLIFHELQQAADSPAKTEVRAVLQGYRKLLLGVLNRAVAQEQIPADTDTDAAATSFIGLLQGLVMQSMLTDSPSGMHQPAERVFALYLRGLRGTP